MAVRRWPARRIAFVFVDTASGASPPADAGGLEAKARVWVAAQD